MTFFYIVHLDCLPHSFANKVFLKDFLSSNQDAVQYITLLTFASPNTFAGKVPLKVSILQSGYRAM